MEGTIIIIIIITIIITIMIMKAVVADVCMPVVDGIQFLKIVKANDKAKGIPVIMVSGLEASEISENCSELGNIIISITIIIIIITTTIIIIIITIVIIRS
jgi:CheY-like chemotaxis protein